LEDRNSYEEFALGMLRAILVDCAAQYPELTKEFDRDYKRLCSAVNSHGLYFIVSTMPTFRKHFDKCLAEARLTQSHLFHFGGGRKGEVIPRLFRGLFLRVFDRSGALRLDPDLEAIRHLRQLLGVFRKLRMSSSTKDTGNSILDFFRTDQEVKSGNLSWDNHLSFEADSAHELSYRELSSSAGDDRQAELDLDLPPRLPSSSWALLDKIQRSADLISSWLGEFNPEDWRPSHGPGAVSDQHFSCYKYEFKNWSDRLESVFPYDLFAKANYLQDMHNSEYIDSVRWNVVPPARLHAVPKTLTTPRLIAAEPVANQWVQQVIKDYMYSRVRETPIGALITFHDQGPNGKLALEASRDGSHATIDLSSASDLVSCWHVERLFRRLPSLLYALQASRSVWIEQDICKYSPKYYYLRKYSTMGNATTFPVQSLLFLAIGLGVFADRRGLEVNNQLFKIAAREGVRVFGDDIIVPADCSGTMVGSLKSFGLKVNSKKTFETGKFRESCGVDAYGGHDVTTVSVLDVPRRTSPGSVVSTVDVHHNLASRGYMHTAQWLQKTAGRMVGNTIPFVRHGSGRFGWSDLYGELPTSTRRRWNAHLQVVEVWGLHQKVKAPRLPPKTTAGLLQYFLEAPRVVTSAVSHLGHLGQRPKVGLSLRWAVA
jgi:hypothetical protein